jgi:CRISPR-associated endonuclease Csn1
MAGGDPKAEGGCLEETEAVRAYREGRPFDQQTNNHLVRHRLLILERLVRDLVADPQYGAGDPSRFTRVTIEVNRELRDHSGLTAQEIAKDLGLRLSSHSKAVKWLEDSQLEPSGALIRKARVALDLGCRCPYTDTVFEAVNLRDGVVDLDHIIPRSLRPSDSLDSLVITYPAVNRWKGNRTAWQFIQDCGGQQVPGAPHLTIVTPQRFKDLVARLDSRGPHEDDTRRKRRRKEFFELQRYEDNERNFTPGQLTQTSQLTRLARIAVRRHLRHLGDHDFVALPGSVTGAVRKAWNLMGCLATVAPEVLDSDGTLRPKSDIRSITHLHHAVDAVTLGYATALIPSNGVLWQLLSLRSIPVVHREFFANALPVELDAQGRWRLRGLLENHPAIDRQIRVRLAERRVVQHVPADMSGLGGLEQNTWRVTKVDGDRVHLRQKAPRDAGGVRETAYKHDEIEAEKAFGLRHGRLKTVKGARVLGGNFAIAVLSSPGIPDDQRVRMIRHNQVFKAVRELTLINGGQRPLLYRAGSMVDVPRGSRKGRWRIISPKKSEAYGLSFDLAAVDGMKRGKGDAPVAKLLQDGMRLLKTSYAGSVLT